jgi:hypothetical protein
VHAHDIDALSAACPGLRELSLHAPHFHGWPAAAVLPHVTLLKMPGAWGDPPALRRLAPGLRALTWECSGHGPMQMAKTLHEHTALTSLDIAGKGYELDEWVSQAAYLPALSSLTCTMGTCGGYDESPADFHGIVRTAGRLAENESLTCLKFRVAEWNFTSTPRNAWAVAALPAGRALAAVAAAAPGGLRELELGGCALPEGAAEDASLAAATLAGLPLLAGLERLTLVFPEAQALNDAVLAAIVGPLAGARKQCNSLRELRFALTTAHCEEWGGAVTAACRARLCAANPGLSFEV